MAFEPKLSILTSLYQSENYLPHFLKQVSEQSVFAESELILVLNEGSREEIEAVKNFSEQYPQQVQLLQVEKVELLSASWNRAWRAAKAPYMAIWNVDDRRRPDSLLQQVKALDEHSDWVMAYGDFVKVSKYGDEEGYNIHTPNYSRSLFRRSIPHGGAFLVFRGDLHAEVGRFDEQLAIGPDFEMSVRVAMRGLQMGRVNSILGYFTNEGSGLSTRMKSPSIETKMIYIRYAVYDHVRNDGRGIKADFDIDTLLVEGKWIPLSNYLPELFNYRRKRRPLWAIGFLRNQLRSIFRKIGLLEAIYAFQKKFIKRDI
jgi:glycosyltransferase involved in cell wall biosynthesis